MSHTTNTRLMGQQVEHWFKANLGKCIIGHRDDPDWVERNGGADANGKIDGYLLPLPECEAFGIKGTYQLKADCRGLNFFGGVGTPNVFIDEAVTTGGADWFIILLPGLGFVTYTRRVDLVDWYHRHRQHEVGSTANRGIPWPVPDYVELPFLQFEISPPLYRYFATLW